MTPFLSMARGAAAVITMLTSTAVAADDGGTDDWILTVGAGAQVSAKYPGADDTGLYFLPIFAIRREDEPLPVVAPDDSAGVGVLRLIGEVEPFDFGPVVAFQTERDPADVGASVNEVDTTIEAGAFAQVFVAPSVRLRVEGRRGLGGHDGWVGHIAADYVYRTSEWVITAGPRAGFSDDSYSDAYFSVTPELALISGISEFQAGGGFHSLGAKTGARWQLSPEWGVHASAGYERLVGNAADSPLVTEFGDRDQFEAALGISYSFKIGGL